MTRRTKGGGQNSMRPKNYFVKIFSETELKKEA
jgi:hypothetical protein